MNVTFNTNNLTSQYKYNNSRRNKNQIGSSQQTFTSLNPPTDSKILNPVKRGLENLTDKIARNYTAKVYTSPLARKIAEKAENWDGVVNAMQISGSAIISFMYMIKTLNNDKLDEKRKQTLSINQGLTFGLSTACGMWLDSKLDNQWENFTRRFVGRQIGDEDFKSKIEAVNAEYIQDAEEKYNKTFKELSKKERPKMVTSEQYINTLNNIKKIEKFETLEELKNLNLDNFENNAKPIVESMNIPEAFKDESALKLLKKVFKAEKLDIDNLAKLKADAKICGDLAKNLTGMNLLKKIMVFGTVYRFFGPVAVTPLATWVGNTFLHKEEKETKKSA